MMNKKYVHGKYNPLRINEIILKSRVGYEEQIPDTYRRNSMFYIVFKSIWIIIRNLASGIILSLKKNRVPFKELLDGKVLFVLPTLNNQRSLSKIIEIVSKEKGNVRIAKNEFFPKCYVSVMSFLYLPVVWKEIKELSKADRRVVAFYLWHFVVTPGIVRSYFRMLQKNKPECVVLSNDHMCFTKSLELVCEDLGIKTIYVQHASVSFDFPELHFAYSFLDGRDSYVKYTCENKKTNGVVVLLGAARYDALSEYRTKRNIAQRNCIGVAVNELDDNGVVNSFCNELLRAFPSYKIKVRSHPALKERPFIFDNKERIIYTCASDEPMIEYLDDIDFQISNDSGVHFDAIIGGVNTVAYNFSKSVFSDVYGYVKGGLIKYAESIEQIIDYSKIRPNISVVRFYDESYQKTYSGECSHIIAEFILNGYDIENLRKRYEMQENEGYLYIKD